MESQDPLSNSSFPQADSIYEDTDADDVDSIYQYKASVHVMKTLNVMRENGEFCDLVIELSNTKFQVHQTVIAVWSPVLKNLLQCQTGRQHVHISYDKPEVFKHLLSFVYTGTFQDETPNIPAILLLAATFQIQLLKELCVEHLKSTVTADNVISLYHLAGKYQLPDLKHHCLDILRQHLPEVAQKNELRELSPRQINSFLGCELVSKKLDPEMKLFLIISWLTEDVNGRQQYLVLLLGHIDWSVVAADFLEEISQTENFFTSNPASLYLLLQTLHSSNISLGPYEKQFQSLREQYSYLLSSVVSGSVISGPTKADKFKPVRFTLISHSKEGVVSMNRQGSSKEDEDTEDFNMDESCNEEDLYYDNVDQSVSKHEHAKSSNITVSSPFTLAGSEIPLQPSLTRDDGLVSDPFPETATSTTCSSNTSSTVEGSMKRKRVRPRRFITDIDTVVPKSNESRTRKDHKTKSSKQNLEHKRESSSSLTINEAAGHETGRPARTKKVVQIGTEKQKTYNSDLNETERKPTGMSQKESETAAESEQGEVTVGGAKKQDPPRQEKRKRGRPPKSVKAKTSSQFTQIKDIATQRTRNASDGKSQEQMQTEKKSEAKLQLLTCSYCDFTTCSRSKLMRHHKKVHEGNCLFCCNLCSFVSKWSKEYHDHMKEKHFPAAKRSSTAIRRAKMKLEDPERYAAFLESEKERNRQSRARKRSEWLNGKRTKAAIEAHEKQLANGRERYRRYMERHRPDCLKRRSSIQSCLHKESKRPRDMTPEELRAHKAEMKRQWRQQNSLKRRDREAKKKPGRSSQNCQEERPQTQAKDVTPAEEPRKQKAAKPSSTAISRLMSSLQQAKDVMPAEEPRKQKAAKPSSTAISRLMSSLQQAKDVMPAEEPIKQKAAEPSSTAISRLMSSLQQAKDVMSAEEPIKQKAAKPSSTAISRPVSSLQQAKDVTPAREPRKQKAAKLSRTAIRRAKMKLEDPERYCAFLEKEKERNRQYRAKKRWKWLNERRTNAAIAAHEKELAKGRERYRRYVEKHGTTKRLRHRIFRNRHGETKRPKDMTPDERRAHNAALKREWRQMQSEEKKSLIKENDRQYKKAQRDAIRKLRIGAASPPTASAHDGTLIFAVPDAPQEEQKKGLRIQKDKEAKTARRATRKRLKDGNASLPTAPACVVTVSCAVPNSPPPHSPTCVSSQITQSHNTHPNKSPQTKPALDWNSALTELLTSPLALSHGLTKQEPLVESSFQELTELESSSFLLSITEAPLSPEEECDLPPPPSPCDSVESLPAADFPPPPPVEEGPTSPPLS